MDSEHLDEAGRRGAEAVAALAAQLGPHSRRIRAVIRLLAEEGPQPLDSLIRFSGLSRRTVEELLAAAGPDVEETGLGYLLRSGAATAYLNRFGATDTPGTQPEFAGAPELTGPGDLLPAGLFRAVAPPVVDEVVRLIAGAPAAKQRLDHVAATPATALRRAVWLGATYDPARTRLLFVGDHDLTSLAACLVNRKFTAWVADLDEDLLAYVDASARRLGLDVRCCYADFRFGLPPELAGWADVAFTDPPYTPEGVALFAARGLEGLRAREFGNVVVCYGAGERHPGLAWKVQQALAGGLGLAYEAIWPKFNVYSGAQAIGSRSDLYVCRPTSATWKALGQHALPGGPRIYTHGPQALEAAGEAPRADVQAAVLRLASRDGEVPLTAIVGEGWTAGDRHTGGPADDTHTSSPADDTHTGRPADDTHTGRPADDTHTSSPADDAHAVGSAAHSRAGASPTDHRAGASPTDDRAGASPTDRRIPAAHHAHLATLLGKGLPSDWTRGGGAVVIDLSADPGPWLARTLLAANASRVAALIPNNHPDAASAHGQSALRDLLHGKYDLRFHRSVPGPAHAVVEAVRAVGPGPQARLRRFVLERAHGAVLNAWREGLIRLARSEGRQLTKNEAREIIDAASDQHRWWPARLIDMPRHQITELLALLDETAPG